MLFERLKRFFRKAGEKVGVNKSITLITDHPRVAVSSEELNRINENIRLYSGRHPPVTYINSYGEEKKRDYYNINMTKVLSNRMARLVFNEKCKIITDQDQAQQFLEKVFHENDFQKNFERYLESCFALGGLAIRPYISNGAMRLAWCQAGSFLPLRANSGGVSEAVIRTVTERVERGKQFYYTLLEFHEWQEDRYIVTNELYQSEDKNRIGQRVPLNTIYDNGLQDEHVFTSLTRPVFVYLKPAGMNNLDLTSPFGLGICDNAKSTLKQINNAYDAFHWEIKTAKRKIGISDHFLTAQYDETGKTLPRLLEDDCDTFLALPGGIDDMVRKEWAFEIRSAKYIESISHFIKTLEIETGFSAGTFSFDGYSVKTATEVISENSITYQTRNSHVAAVEKAIKELVISILEMGKTYGLYAGPVEGIGVGVDFDDGVFVDKEKQLDYYGKAKTYGFIPTSEAIQRVFEIPEATADEWIRKMQTENTQNNPPPDDSLLY